MKKCVVFIALATLLVACKENSRVLPSPSGRAGEVLVVMNDVYWNDDAGKFLFESLTQDMVGIAWSEPIFDISRIPRAAYSDMVRIARNVVDVDVGDRYSSGKVKFYREKFSRTQAYVKIQAPDAETLLQTLKENEMKILSFLYSAERERLMSYFKNNNHELYTERVKEKVGYDLIIPIMFNHDNFHGKDFAWLSGGNTEARTDLALYTFPCSDESLITLDYLIAIRDSVMKINIPGPSDGSYMCTETLVEPTFNKIKINNKELFEVRGLWKTTIDLMGGPFVSYYYYDKQNKMMKVLEGFIYAPHEDKRNLIRRIEAVAYSWNPEADLRLSEDSELVAVDSIQ